MRPKSIATVVCSLTPYSSDPGEIVSSVETTSISLIDRMHSVFPALNGPVTTIFTVWIGMSDRTLRCYKALNLPRDEVWARRSPHDNAGQLDQLSLTRTIRQPTP